MSPGEVILRSSDRDEILVTLGLKWRANLYYKRQRVRLSATSPQHIMAALYQLIYSKLNEMRILEGLYQ